MWLPCFCAQKTLRKAVSPLASLRTFQAAAHTVCRWSSGLKSLAPEAGVLGPRLTFWGSRWVCNLDGEVVCLDPKKGSCQDCWRKFWKSETTPPGLSAAGALGLGSAALVPCVSQASVSREEPAVGSQSWSTRCKPRLLVEAGCSFGKSGSPSPW